MGQLATQAQNVQMQAMNPQRQMKQLLEKSWPRIAAVMPQEMSEKRLYQMYVRTPAGQLLGRIGVVMLHALHEPRSGTVERERARHGLHPAIR